MDDGSRDGFHPRVPLIVYDPSPEAVRDRTSDTLVQAIDLIPTFLEALGRPVPDPVLEGRSLLPLLRGGRPAEEVG